MNLFVYGTLLQSNNPFGSYLQNNSRWLSTGKFRGRLYDIGQYPGAVLNTSADTYVWGHLVSLTNSEHAFRILDEYEGYGSEFPEPNEFIRQVIEVETESYTLQCWTYLYNLPVTGLLCIESGNYEDYISKK
jgi:gamma-glutamylcyclotransferase (GGCT)/AIG2-like uncharacterized protein YtfP